MEFTLQLSGPWLSMRWSTKWIWRPKVAGRAKFYHRHPRLGDGIVETAFAGRASIAVESQRANFESFDERSAGCDQSADSDVISTPPQMNDQHFRQPIRFRKLHLPLLLLQRPTRNKRAVRRSHNPASCLFRQPSPPEEEFHVSQTTSQSQTTAAAVLPSPTRRPGRRPDQPAQDVHR